MQRTSTGIPGLSEILHGGLITNHSYLVVGAAGTGKTIASIQWLIDGEAQGEKGLYITLAEPIENLRRNVQGFGWNLEDLAIVDLNTPDQDPSNSISEYNIFPPSEVERAPMWDGIYRAVKQHQPQRCVIDSMTQLRYLSTDDYQFRKQILSLVIFLQQRGCTSFLTFEPSELERETSIALAVDGIIRLRVDISPSRVIGLRSIQVEKLRGSDFMSGRHPMRFTSDGIRVFPHRIEPPQDTRPGDTRLSSGVDSLDELIGGGLESGTSTIISGPCGAGKSTLGMQFLRQAAAKGQRSILYAFEESPAAILHRSQRLGAPVEEMLEKDLLKVVQVNPMELYPDEFLFMIRNAVEKDERRAVMIDSLRGYELAMEEFGSSVAHIHNMLIYLNRMQATTLLINEIERITGNLVATELGVSYIADNILFLRYAEYKGRIIKVVTCLKKRHSAFNPSLREMHITDSGIEVGRTLDDLQGILAGVPTTSQENA